MSVIPSFAQSPNRVFKLTMHGGVLELECDNDILLEGGIVKSGGTLKVTGKKIVMGKKFTVEKGGKLILTTSN